MRRLGRVGDRVDINMPGEQLQITFRLDFQVCMRGPVHKIASLRQVGLLSLGCVVLIAVPISSVWEWRANYRPCQCGRGEVLTRGDFPRFAIQVEIS